MNKTCGKTDIKIFYCEVFFMIYVGIDIAKTNHYASIIDSNGEVIQEPFLVKNNQDGFNLLYQKIKNYDKEKILIGLESTAHYGNNIIYFFFKKGFKIAVINPIQTSTLRKTNIRKVKNDKVDSILIVKTLMMNCYTLLTDYDVEMIELKSLCRYRHNLMTMRTKSKIQLATYVDQLFPELNSFFKNNLHINTSYQLLKEHSSPTDIANCNLIKLTNILIKASKGKYNKDRANELKQIAKASVGIDNPALSIQIRLTIEQIEIYSKQIDEIETKINNYMQKSDNVITSIPGIANTTAAIIISELGNINRFNNSSKVIAYAGLDSTIKQSGNFNARTTRMSKRGSSFLRYALILAANNVRLNTKTFNEYYTKKCSQGKSHYNSLGHCASKLVRMIFKMLSENKSFNIE
jgi:transposase